MFDLSAWLGKSVEELKVVLSFVETCLDLLSKVNETWKIRAGGILEDFDNLLELIELESLCKDN